MYFSLSNCSCKALLQLWAWVTCCSFTQSCLTLWDSMDCKNQASMSFTISWSLLTLMSIESVMPSNHPVPCHPLLLLPSIFPSIFPRSFPMSHLFTSGGQCIGASTSASVLPVNIQDWFPLGLTGLISLLSKGLSRVFHNTTAQKHQFFSAQSSYGPTVTSIHDYWKNHSFDYRDLCWESDVSGF